eukprot:scaffold28812_cov78-Cyclotella_meneghiniana.AAC.5
MPDWDATTMARFQISSTALHAACYNGVAAAIPLQTASTHCLLTRPKRQNLGHKATHIRDQDEWLNEVVVAVMMDGKMIRGGVKGRIAC